MGFRLVPKLMILKGIMALILSYFTEFGSFVADYVRVVNDTPMLSTTTV